MQPLPGPLLLIDLAEDPAMVAAAKTNQKRLALVPVNLHQVRKLVAQQLRRQADASSENRLAAALGWPRSSLRVRMEDPQTFTADELDELMPKLKMTLHINLV